MAGAGAYRRACGAGACLSVPRLRKALAGAFSCTINCSTTRQSSRSNPCCTHPMRVFKSHSINVFGPVRKQPQRRFSHEELGEHGGKKQPAPFQYRLRAMREFNWPRSSRKSSSKNKCVEDSSSASLNSVHVQANPPTRGSECSLHQGFKAGC